MRLISLLVALGAAMPLAAQSRNPYPAEFTPAPCAPGDSCTSFPRSNMPSAAAHFLGLHLEADWVDEHADAVLKAMEPACRLHASCLGTAGNIFWFCDDILTNDVRPVCDTLFPKSTNLHDWRQCGAFRETYLIGLDQRAEDMWKGLQECAKKAAPAHDKPLDLWMDPSTIPPRFSGTLKFYALDPDTHVPVLAGITFENERLFAPANPVGNPVTYYPIEYTLKYVRVPNADGHTDLIPPMVTVKAPAYPEVADAPPYPVMQFRLAAVVPKLVVEMKPPADKLRSGENKVTISAHDAVTGKAVEMRVMVGLDQAGNTNEPITIEIEKSGPRPEVWLTSLFNQYSDVVVAKPR